ncbi:hypothetical protein LC613_09350 [Nostoc sphaeroides CHAB 2801]|uniref:hypothetical protein n=1 Tax=Nostoc sphaeroides TaxID=446679 RepID=UPI001C6FF1E0|nr:hypothetical protein [Nostoc sphaeroides]MCC5628306.1 hypothetical protein [Nostoc sphaeroides CHAB 2801]
MTVHEFSVNNQQSTVNDFKWNNLFFGVPLYQLVMRMHLINYYAFSERLVEKGEGAIIKCNFKGCLIYYSPSD